MAKGFKHGAGGGTSLNFKVVGNPQPSTAKENTIWIDTDVPITGYYFQQEQPENMTEGMVWIFTGTSSTMEFNALKKNGIQVYPISAKQYIVGAWVDKTAKSYQGGEWVDWWNGELYSPGNEWPNVTGGWVNRINAAITRTENYLEIHKTSTSSMAFVSTNIAIDFTNVTRIEMEYSNNNEADSGGLFLQNGSVPSSGASDWAKKVAKASFAKINNLDDYRIVALDTTAISGKYLVYFMIYTTARVKNVRIYFK